ncbi:MAG: hypothetical protein Q9M23_06620, partial [Mariprofundaceae bacterium]|nr:hypothetical protein [Mariprofundaceae bacterium]
GRDTHWLTAGCRKCDAEFDFHVELSKLPVKPAGGGYPVVESRIKSGLCRFRIPTGADQEAIASLHDQGEACTTLLNLCLIDIDGNSPPAVGIAFDADEQVLIDTAMDAVAPEMAMEIQTSCPECGAENVVSLDPYAFLGRVADIYADIHTLAWYYHWGEEEILAMPRARRQEYLALIDQARGMQRQPSGAA